jgi:hypothetical protein
MKKCLIIAQVLSNNFKMLLTYLRYGLKNKAPYLFRLWFKRQSSLHI